MSSTAEKNLSGETPALPWRGSRPGMRLIVSLFQAFGG
jgi:hypothetical protein